MNGEMKRIAVVGMGYIGLPTAVMFASSGFTVTGIEIVRKKIEQINKGACYIEERGLPERLREVVDSGRLSCTDDFSRCKDADTIIVCVETPLQKGTNEPDYRPLKSALTSASKNMKRGALLIVESTIAPTTTHKIILPLVEKASGMRAGSDFYFAHCPERILPGKMIEEMINNDRLIGGADERSSKLARDLYASFVKGEMVTADPLTVEMVKVSENTFRDVNIALANELAMVCEKLGINAHEVIRLANKHPRVSIHHPGAGVGGHCIPKDPHLLMWGAGGKDVDLIRAARKINDGMPGHVIGIVRKALKSGKRELKRARIGVLGLAYKEDSDDMREAPALAIINGLRKIGASVRAFDPHVGRSVSESLGLNASASPEGLFKGADCIVIVTAHREFRDIDFPRMGGLMRNRAIVDGRNMLDGPKMKSAGFVYLGVGNP